MNHLYNYAILVRSFTIIVFGPLGRIRIPGHN